MVDAVGKLYRLFRKEGIRAGGKIAYRIAKLRFEIFARGRNKVVSLDGCHFPLRKLPNTIQKLELLRGVYELPERSAVRRYIQPEWAVIELGGCIGVVACITNKLLNNPEAHIVLEANPLVIPHLERNREANVCSFTITNAALAYERETVTFSPWTEYQGNSLYVDGGKPAVTVAATYLGKILDQAQFKKFAVICDIEGQEYQLIMEEADILGKAELIILELHPHLIGEEKASTVLSKLENLNFKVIERSGSVVVLGKT